MKITVNGDERRINESINLVSLLQNLELPLHRIAVELNRNVVRRDDWETIEIKDGDKLEIVHFVGGG